MVGPDDQFWARTMTFPVPLPAGPAGLPASFAETGWVATVDSASAELAASNYSLALAAPEVRAGRPPVRTHAFFPALHAGLRSFPPFPQHQPTSVGPGL